MTPCLSAESLLAVMMAHYVLYTILSYTEYVMSVVFTDIRTVYNQIM